MALNQELNYQLPVLCQKPVCPPEQNEGSHIYYKSFQNLISLVEYVLMCLKHMGIKEVFGVPGDFAFGIDDFSGAITAP